MTDFSASQDVELVPIRAHSFRAQVILLCINLVQLDAEDTISVSGVAVSKCSGEVPEYM